MVQASAVGLLLQLARDPKGGEVPTAAAMLAAAAAGHDAVVAVLLVAGVSAHPAPASQQSPLLLAAQAGHEAVVALLLAAAPPPPGKQLSKQASPPRSRLGVVQAAGEGGGEEAAHALILASQAGAAGVVEQLLVAGVSARATWGQQNATALHAAACSTEQAAVATQLALVRQRARLEARLSVSRATPLHVAAQRGTWPKLLAEHANLNARLADNTTPLMLAAAAGHGSWVARLLQQPEASSTPTARTRSGRSTSARGSSGLLGPSSGSSTPSAGSAASAISTFGTSTVATSSAASSDSTSAASAADSVSAPGSRAEVDAVDSRGHTALHLAAHSGCAAAVKALLEHGADLGIVAGDGATALDLALAAGHSGVARSLRGRHRSVVEHVQELAAKIKVSRHCR